jgi:hypothetical protein
MFVTIVGALPRLMTVKMTKSLSSTPELGVTTIPSGISERLILGPLSNQDLKLRLELRLLGRLAVTDLGRHFRNRRL